MMEYARYYRCIYYVVAHHGFTYQDIKFLVKELDLPKNIQKDLLEASRFEEIYRKEGVYVFKHIYPEDRARKFVDSFWDHLLSLPYKEKQRQKIEKEIQRLGLRKNPWRDLTKRDMKVLRELYPMTGGFGALTLPPAFHTPWAWDARQDPVIYAVFTKLFGTKDILCTFDRLSFKFPGQGQTEFTHWDSNPWDWSEESTAQIQGILALSKTSFRAVSRTHTLKFRDKFISKYPESKRYDQYHVTSAHDPLELQKQVQTYPLDIGDLVIWSDRVLHEARKNKTKKIRYAMFLSYYPRKEPPLGMVKSYEKERVDIMKDRRLSFATGKNPLFHPGGTRVRLYARMHLLHWPDKLVEFCNMWYPESGVCKDYTYKSGAKKGRTIQVPVQWNPRELGIYEPPELTEIGVQVLGFEP